MTQRLNISLKSLAAMLLLLSSLLLCPRSARAEIRLHASTGMQFSLAFRPAAAAAPTPMLSVQPPDVEELSIGSLYTAEINLQRQQASLSKLSPQLSTQSCSLSGLIGEKVARFTDHDTRALPLDSAAWNFPKACIELVSSERPAPQLLASRPLVLNADYAATAFGGTCTAWDLTSSLRQGNGGVSAPGEDHMASVRLAIAIPPPSTVAYRNTPMRAVASQMNKAEQLTASVRDPQTPQQDLPEPTRKGDAVRPWVLTPNMAAKFRGNGFQLISTDNAAKSRSASPTVRRPSLR